MEKQEDSFRNMVVGYANWARDRQDKLDNCKETLEDYRNMITSCNNLDNNIHYMPYHYFDGIPYYNLNITPVEPFIMKNFSWDDDFSHPPLRRINMSPGIVLLKGGCNHSDPFSQCL